MSDKENNSSNNHSIVVNECEYLKLKSQYENLVKDKGTLIRELNELSIERTFLRQQLETLTASLKSINSLVEILTETEKD